MQDGLSSLGSTTSSADCRTVRTSGLGDILNAVIQNIPVQVLQCGYEFSIWVLQISQKFPSLDHLNQHK